jgi:hypothetical protein
MAATTHHDLSAEFTLYAITGPAAYSCLGAGKVRMAATIHRFRVVMAACRLRPMPARESTTVTE